MFSTRPAANFLSLGRRVGARQWKSSMPLKKSPMLDFSESLRAAEHLSPSSLDDLVLGRLVAESDDLLNSPIMRPWVLDLRKADNLPNAASRVLARKICGAEAGLEMDVEVGGLNTRVDYLIPIFEAALKMFPSALSLDLLAITTLDPAAKSYLQPFLFFKGFHAVALQRIGHRLWMRSGDPTPLAAEALRKPQAPPLEGEALESSERLKRLVSAEEAWHTALWIQCRCSEVFGVDMHPGARIGAPMFLDHATGVVIGETATIGNHCHFLHNVTLGGTGKPPSTLLRHPQIGDRVTVGAGATVLGDIRLEDGVTVGAQAVVTKPVASGNTVIGLNKVLSAKQKSIAKEKGANPGTWWAETDLPEHVESESTYILSTTRYFGLAGGMGGPPAF
mmetsp:Transcript_34913/g.78890  ORF Transcript_34913/g.78890 Transcript_34913/m.78890 type:complete len:392 (+) Transcript_34913:128-1303(+)